MKICQLNCSRLKRADEFALSHSVFPTIYKKDMPYDKKVMISVSVSPSNLIQIG